MSSMAVYMPEIIWSQSGNASGENANESFSRCWEVMMVQAPPEGPGAREIQIRTHVDSVYSSSSVSGSRTPGCYQLDSTRRESRRLTA